MNFTGRAISCVVGTTDRLRTTYTSHASPSFWNQKSIHKGFFLVGILVCAEADRIVPSPSSKGIAFKFLWGMGSSNSVIIGGFTKKNCVLV